MRRPPGATGGQMTDRDTMRERTKRMIDDAIWWQIENHGRGDSPHITAGMMGEIDARIELQLLDAQEGQK